MALLRRGIQIAALVGTLVVGIIALALIVSQTGWFRERVRRYMVRQANQYLNGELSIGRLSGNLFFGAELSDVAVVVAGERVIAVRQVGVDYSVLDLVSRGIVIDDIRLDEPRLVIRRTAEGWNLGRLVKEERREAEREGPARPVAIGSIGISGGDFVLEGVGTVGGAVVPRRLQQVDAKLSFDYAPVHYTVGLDHLSFRAIAPGLAMTQLKGTIAVRDDNFYFEDLVLRTAESSLDASGVIEQYLRHPIIKVTAKSDKFSLPEIARVLPILDVVKLQPAFEIDARGPLERLVVDLNIRSSGGGVQGATTFDLEGPRRAAGGTVNLRDLNLAAVFGRPNLKSRITGKTTFDLAMPPGGLETMSGPFTFSGPRVAFAGYQAEEVDVKGRLAGPRVEIDGRARAYGGASSARGVIVQPGRGRALALDLRGGASSLDLRRLPKNLRVPALATDLNADWHLVMEAGGRGPGSGRLNADAVLGASVIEDASFASGTTASLTMEGERLEYAAKGAVDDLDLQRFGRALEVAALAADRFASSVTGPFDVKGTVPLGSARGDGPLDGARGRPILDTITIDASGETVDTRIFGSTLPRLAYTARLDRGSLTATANGTFAAFNPAVLTGRSNLDGNLAGRLNVAATIDDVGEPIRPETVNASGQVELSQSTIAGITIDQARIDGQLDRGNGTIKALEIKGEDLQVTASGPVALGEAEDFSRPETQGPRPDTNITYHVDTSDLKKIGQLVDQPLAGSVTVDGRLTGTRANLKSEGTLNGSSVKFGENGALDLNAKFSLAVPDLSFADATIGAETNAAFVTVGGLELREVAAKTTYEGNTLEFDSTINDRGRELKATGTLIVHADHNELHLPALSMRSQGLEWRLDGSDATVQFDRREIRMKDLRFVSASAGAAQGAPAGGAGQQSLAIEGTIARSSPEAGTAPDAAAANLQVKASNVDIAQLEKLTLQDRGFGGLLSADARITGSLGAPRVDGSVAVTKGHFRTFTFESLKAEMDYTGDGIRLDARLQQNATQWLTAKGFAPMTLFRFEPTGRAEHVAPGEADRIDLRIESSPIDLGIIQGLTSVVTDVKGSLQANVRVTGSGRDPHLEGVVSVTGGAFKVPAVGASYTGFETRIDLQSDKMVVAGFELRDDNGNPLLVSGELATHERELGAVNLQFQADNFEVVDNDLGDVEVDSVLRVTGDFRRPRVEGTISLEAGRIEVDRVLAVLGPSPYATEATSAPDVEPGVQVVDASGGARQATARSLTAAAGAPAAPIEPVEPLPPAPLPPLVDRLALDLRVEIPDNLVLRGADLRPAGRGGLALGDINLTVGGDLRVHKDQGKRLTLTGTINTVRGFYQFQGRRFDVTRDGRIRFVGLPEMNPLIDVTAIRVIDGVEARVHIRGTARAPELTLSSTPPLDESDILSLIVFNASINSLGTDERISLAQRAGAIASGFVAAPLAESIGRALDVDLFEIETTSDAGFGAAVTLGQQVSEELFLRFRQTFGPQDASEFITEYKLAEFLRFQGSVAPGGGVKANRSILRRVERGAADLIFFFSY
jgi:TamB, inner membrane protein subunit of TAM complex